MTESILEYVLEQLQRHKGQWQSVADATGVSKRTIEKIATGEIPDPRVRKIEELAKYFRGLAGETALARNDPANAQRAL